MLLHMHTRKDGTSIDEQAMIIAPSQLGPFRWTCGLYCFYEESCNSLQRYDYQIQESVSRKPECVSDATWEKWLAFWSRPAVMDKSEKASQNRKSEKAGPGTGSSRHSGGSRSAYAHALALENEIGRDAYNCMLHMHTRKDGTFIDEQARIIVAVVEERVRAAREAAGDGDIDMTEIYCQVVPVVKQRLCLWNRVKSC
ncbi:hypothetical protein CASFOL_020130 [Castilleja foliolosa]|uniref:Uncharacterized protein n=1 Tax=Castilleja foliolosa TaxID=1961234 RepID=A0ABD3D0R5_9LAMI